MGFWDEAECAALYQLPIEDLALSARTMQIMTQLGISNIGMAIEVCLRYEFDSIMSAGSSSLPLMKELRGQLQAFGFWVYVARFHENADD